jgi:multisubunit Na+/H+ antiporter MnhB subunit
MKKYVLKMVLLIGALLGVDLLVPGVGRSELAFQGGLVLFFGVLMFFRG